MPGRPSLDLPPDVVELLLHLRDTDPHKLNGFIWLLKEAGWTFSSIARPLGVSRQAIEQRLAKPRDCDCLPSVPVPPKPEPPMPKPKRKSMHLSEETVEKLRALYAVVQTVNGATLEDDPRRQLSLQYTEALAQLVSQGVTVYEIAKKLGVSHGGIYARLGRHGYRTLSPSIEAYKGTSTQTFYATRSN